MLYEIALVQALRDRPTVKSIAHLHCPASGHTVAKSIDLIEEALCNGREAEAANLINVLEKGMALLCATWNHESLTNLTNC